jgi:hypothetical protein
MTGYHSYNKFKKEIKDLKQIYDFTFHLYLQEHEIIKEKIKQKESKVVSFNTSINFITHSLDSLVHYTKDNYPRKLRQLILINTITALEVYFTDQIREISMRTIEPFKTDERVDFQRNHLLNYPTLKGIEQDLLNKDIRKITSGGLAEAKKYYLQRFQIDFENIGSDYNEIQEVHERRHLQVHRNGICDAIYATKYPQYGFKQGDPIKIEHDYLVKSIDLLLVFGHQIKEAALAKYPDTNRATQNIKGARQSDHDDIKLLIEFEVLNNNYNIQTELLDKPIETTTSLFSEYVLQHLIKEKKYNIFVSAPKYLLKKIMKVVKQSERINLINVSEIQF